MRTLNDTNTTMTARLDQALAAARTAEKQVIDTAVPLLCVRARMAYPDVEAITLEWSEQGPFLTVEALLCGAGVVVSVQAGEWEDEESLATNLEDRNQSMWSPYMTIAAGRHHPTPYSYVLPVASVLDRAEEGGAVMQISITDRAIATERGKEALQLLAAHAAATARQLGRAREQLNQMYRTNSAEGVELALVELDALLHEVYGGAPPRHV